MRNSRAYIEKKFKLITSSYIFYILTLTSSSRENAGTDLMRDFIIFDRLSKDITLQTFLYVLNNFQNIKKIAHILIENSF